MYREAARPAESPLQIVLSPHRGRRLLLAFSCWFLAVWLLVWPVHWVVEASMSGEGLWRLALAPVLWAAIPYFITRAIRMESLLIGSHRIVRVGFFRERSIAWSEVRSLRRFERRGSGRRRGIRVPLVAFEAEGRELVVALGVCGDKKRVLAWVLEQVESGRTGDIADRVHQEGEMPKRYRWYLAHFLAALALSSLLGVYLVHEHGRREAERTLRASSSLAAEARLEAIRPVFVDDSHRVTLRCRAGSGMVNAQVSFGDAAGALQTCREMHGLGCLYLPYESPDCTPLQALSDAALARDTGDYARAVELLAESPVNFPLRYGIEVAALTGIGRFEEARTKAADCLRHFGDSERVTTQTLIQSCREALNPGP